jgi:zinc protease
MERRDFPLIGMEVSLSWDGTLAEPGQRLGARLSSMLMDSGPALSRMEAKRLEDMGIRWSAGVDDTHMWGTLVAPSGREDEAVKAFSALFMEPMLHKKALKKRRAWWANWRDQLPHDLDRSHERAINHAIFRGGHPWRHMVQASDLARTSWRTARGMPQHIAKRGQLQIAVVGDTDTSNILPVLEAYFGELDGRERPFPTAVPEMEKGLHLVHQEGFGVARVSLVLAIPGADDPKHFVAEALAWVLAGRETSRLDLALREEQGLSYSIETEITAEKNWGLLRFDTEVLPENVGALLDAMNGLVDQLRDEGVAPEEFEAIRRSLVLDRARRLTLTHEAVTSLGGLMRSQQAPDAFSAQASAFALLQSEELNELAQSIFAEGERTWIVTGDAERIRPQLAELGWEFATDTDAQTLSDAP